MKKLPMPTRLLIHGKAPQLDTQDNVGMQAPPSWPGSNPLMLLQNDAQCGYCIAVLSTVQMKLDSGLFANQIHMYTIESHAASSTKSSCSKAS